MDHSDAEDFLAAAERDLDAAEGRTANYASEMKLAATNFALNGRRLVAMAREAGRCKIEAAPMRLALHDCEGEASLLNQSRP